MFSSFVEIKVKMDKISSSVKYWIILQNYQKNISVLSSTRSIITNQSGMYSKDYLSKR